MSQPKFKEGEIVLTDYHKTGVFEHTRITAVHEGAVSQTGITYQVAPPLNPKKPDEWYDQDWFVKVPTI